MLSNYFCHSTFNKNDCEVTKYVNIESILIFIAQEERKTIYIYIYISEKKYFN